MSKERADVFIREIANNLDEYRHKWKQYFYLKGYQWDEDLLSDTIVKCYDTISRLGLREGANESWNYLFKARFKYELEFKVDVSLGPMCETFTIDIRDLSPYAVSKVVVWNYPIG